MAKVTIVPTGDTQYHVHSVGCSDLRKRHGRHLVAAWDAEVSNLQGIVEDVYADMLDEDDDWQSYAKEFKVYPCASI